MAAAAGTNVWAILADEDPSDNEADKRHERETKKAREAAEYKHQQAVAAAAASEAAVGNTQSSTATAYGTVAMIRRHGTSAAGSKGRSCSQ
jgi:hypothetical protein